MRAAALFAIGLFAACNGSHAATVDAKTDPAVCKANREAAIDRSCTTATDCVLVDSADCCGTIKIAVHAGTQSGYPAVEQTYETCLACPPLGCQHADQAEDGTTPQQGQSIVATCTAGRCTSIVQ